ncbi:hypothetical protein [Burkholderia territorii]|uniref:hypothetical protein n=1 Tax=Burkholderia territorii TaxID=1503055 RepID=UPI0012DAF09B|nr:hypothetical protein [Burkholderia territorii]
MQFIQFATANNRFAKANPEWCGFITRNRFIGESLFRALTRRPNAASHGAEPE